MYQRKRHTIHCKHERAHGQAHHSCHLVLSTKNKALFFWPFPVSISDAWLCLRMCCVFSMRLRVCVLRCCVCVYGVACVECLRLRLRLRVYVHTAICLLQWRIRLICRQYLVYSWSVKSYMMVVFRSNNCNKGVSTKASRIRIVWIENKRCACMVDGSRVFIQEGGLIWHYLQSIYGAVVAGSEHKKLNNSQTTITTTTRVTTL